MSITDPQYPDFTGLTFEKVWAALMEDREQHRKDREETERVFRKSRKKTERSLQQSREETERLRQETDRSLQKSREETESIRQETERLRQETERIRREAWERIDAFTKSVNDFKGDISNRLGEIAEHLVAPNIADKFNELNFDFDKASPNVKIKNPKTKEVLFEFDILLENGKSIVVVEVNTKPVFRDVERLTQRLIRFREYQDTYHREERKVIHGCLAGAVFDANVKKAAEQAGFFVVTQSGDTMQIEMPDEFQPRAF
ncbi:MAG: hypothetical protein LBH00_10885 [Planctomycetaceae bacterium]|jgi:DNA repair exonuclease SbcCD ATPase subunit|nr:hypothetical protein [Planctomycetaceae bacterium]